MSAAYSTPLRDVFTLVLASACVLTSATAWSAGAAPVTETPIEHLIIIVGENISFDNLFATYEPPPGSTVANLLSRGIVDRQGKPGPRFAEALQRVLETLNP